jgi:Tetratricopeptide repeat
MGCSRIRLVQTVVRAGLVDQAERVWASAAIRLLGAGFPQESNEVDNWPECRRLLPHVLIVADHGRRLDVERVVWLWLLHQAAAYLAVRGQHRQAATLFEQALAGRRWVLGDDHPDTLATMNGLGWSRRHLGNLQGARDLLKQTLDAGQRVLGPDHPDTLASTNGIGEVRRELDELQS